MGLKVSNLFFHQILKFGAMIVDNLRVYKQPIIVYLPCAAELRGGAWVVVDPTINPTMMEMYADPDARGGVLEPEGTVQIKFRRRLQEQMMARLDKEYQELSTQHKKIEHAGEQKAKAAEQLETRYTKLAPIYHQVAVKFADLHDTPGRMKKKDCITAVVPWRQARKFFYWRLKRRLLEETLRGLIHAANTELSTDQITAKMRRYFAESSSTQGRTYLWDDNQAVAEWIQTHIDGVHLKETSPLHKNLQSIRQEHALETMKKLVAGDRETLFQGVISMLEVCDAEQIAQLKQMLADKP